MTKRHKYSEVLYWLIIVLFIPVGLFLKSIQEFLFWTLIFGAGIFLLLLTRSPTGGHPKTIEDYRPARWGWYVVILLLSGLAGLWWAAVENYQGPSRKPPARDKLYSYTSELFLRNEAYQINVAGRFVRIGCPPMTRIYGHSRRRGRVLAAVNGESKEIHQTVYGKCFKEDVKNYVGKSVTVFLEKKVQPKYYIYNLYEMRSEGKVIIAYDDLYEKVEKVFSKTESDKIFPFMFSGIVSIALIPEILVWMLWYWRINWRSRPSTP